VNLKKYYKAEVSFGFFVFELPRGTRDFSPDDMYARRFIENKLRQVFQSFGYTEVQTPTFEHLDLFTAKSGDQIIDEIYSFTDKGGRNLALRPELTAPVIRFYVDRFQMEAKPLKFFYFGNCYRYDRPQKGRYREFTQAGCELIGTNTPEAIAELISMAYALVRSVGLEKINLEIGDLTVLNLFFNVFNISSDLKDELIPLIDKQDFDSIREVLQDHDFSLQDIDQFISILQPRTISEFQLFLLKYKDKNAQIDISRLNSVLTLIQDCFSIQDVQVNLGIVRGLEYYSGIVFEIEAPSLGAEKQICGGGEYELLPLFNTRNVPTAGFALGFDRTILAMEMEKKAMPVDSLDYFIIPVSEEMISYALSIAQKLRSSSLKVDIDLMRRGIGKSLKYANKRNVAFAIIIGEDEFEKKAVLLRDMDSGKQELVSLEDLLNKYKQ
jgi:histidyl-tRNA synthetase